MLTNEQIATLRAEGRITEQEIAFIEGDLVIAKNVVSEDKRILGKTVEFQALQESSRGNRQLLKD